MRRILYSGVATRLVLVTLLILAAYPRTVAADSTETAWKPPGFSLVQTTDEPLTVWVASETAGRVSEVDVRAGRVTRRFDVRGGPHNLTVARDGTVITTLQGSGLIAIIREGEVRHVSLGGSPHDVKVAGRFAFVANEGAARLDVVTLGGKVDGAIALKADPHDLSISPTGKLAWVTLDGTDEIAVVDLGRRTVLRYLSTGERPHDLAFAPDGRRVWVTDWESGIHVFSRKGSLIKSIPRGNEPHHLAFTPDGRQAWITDHGANRVLVISTHRLRVLDSKAIGGAPHHVAITDGEAAVANHDQGMVVVFDIDTHRKLDTIKVGAGPHGVWPDPK